MVNSEELIGKGKAVSSVSVAGRIMPMKNYNDTIGNGTRDLLTCSAVPQPTALPYVPGINWCHMVI
jgi:hypothetical protein